MDLLFCFFFQNYWKKIVVTTHLIGENFKERSTYLMNSVVDVRIVYNDACDIFF